MNAAQTVSWDDIRIFLAMYRRGSLGGAARLLRVAHTTIGRRIAALEGALGARLFDRTPTGIALTPVGAALLPRAERMESEILAAERDLRGADARLEGSVRITASDGIVHYVVLPGLSELRRAHTEIELEVRADTRDLDLSRREADVALRLSRPKEASLVARRLGTLRFGLYASRGYLERRGSPRSIADLANHEFIGFDASLDELPQVRWFRKTIRAARASKELRWAIRATTTTAQVVACAESQGIALLGTFIAPREPRLVPVLPRLSTPSRELWLVVHQDVRRNARVAAVSEWLARMITSPMVK